MKIFKIAKYGDQMRKLWLSQGYSDAIIDSYLNTFNEFRKVNVNELFHDIPNVSISKEKRNDISNYKDFKQLENVIDYVRGQRAPKQENVGSSFVAPIYENDGIVIYRGDNAQECIGIRGDDNASWCVAAKNGNMYGQYRYKEKEPTFYFIKDKDSNNKSYNFFVIQVTNNGKYIVTSHANDGDKNMSWVEIVKLQPKLNELQNLFKNIPISEEEKGKYEYYSNQMTEGDFARLSYKDKKQCLDMVGYNIMNDNIFKELPDDLKNYWIGFENGLTKNQFNMIKGNNQLVKRYKEITDRRAIKLINSGESLYALLISDVNILDINNNKDVQEVLLNRIRKDNQQGGAGVPNSPNGFIAQWMMQKIDKEYANGSGEWLQEIAELIKNDDLEREWENYMSSLLSGTKGNIPLVIMEAITKFIEKRGYPPDFAAVWCKRVLDEGRAPKGWIDGILKYVSVEGHSPSFASDWFYSDQNYNKTNSLNKEDAKEELIEASNINWYKKAQSIDIDQRYPIASGIVNGLEVLSDIPNLSSIRASLEKYTVLKGIRVARMDYFSVTGSSYSVSENKRIKELEEKIRQNKVISPLIVVVDKEGEYVLEGSHRLDALYNLGIKEFPALVVEEEYEIEANNHISMYKIASLIKLYRGNNAYNKGGRYYSLSKEWARQFTQSGRDSEIVMIHYNSDKIYVKNPLPQAVSEKEFDEAMEEAKEKGFKAFMLDEGINEPHSVYII